MSQGLGFKALVNAFLEKIEDALHLNDIVEKLKKLFDPKQMGSSSTALSNHATSASKVHEVSKVLCSICVGTYIDYKVK